MKPSITVFLLFFTFLGYGQVHPANIVKDFYNDLNSGDSTKIRSYFFDDAVIKHIGSDTSYSFTIDEFMVVAPMFRSKKFHEEILSIDLDAPISQFANVVQVEYRAYLNGAFHHCGSDVFILTVDDSIYGTKIQRVLTTDGDCWEKSAFEIEKEEEMAKQKQWALDDCDKIMNQWHEDATNANFDGYFEVMADSFYYLGTDPNERWSKTEFSEFCKPYFDKGTTWNFEAENRNWAISEDGNIAWFDEYLYTTNMDYCRGSGVLQLIDGEWKLFHYNLTVLIENEKMDKFLKLRKK